MGRITRQEWAWALTVAALTVVLSSIPCVVGYLSQTPERLFVGAVYDWEDHYSYLAKMQQGMQGEWEFRLLFTPEDHAGAPIYTFHIALGHLSRALGLSPLPVYHAARLVCGMLLLVTIYGFIAAFIPARGDRLPMSSAEMDSALFRRRVAYVLACFSSGLGWLVLLVSRSTTLGGITPVDFWFIEMSTFFTVLTFPHTCLAVAAHLAAFAWMVRCLLGVGGWRDWLAAGGAALVLAAVHPHSLLPLDLALVLYGLFRLIRKGRAAARPLMLLGGFVLLPVPLVFLQYYTITANPVFMAWQAQNLTLSPPPLHYVLGYGLVLLFAVWGAVQALRARDERLLPLLLWPLVVAPLLYAPIAFNLQRRMIDGLQVPLSVLATVGLVDGLLPAVRRSRLAGWLAQRGYDRMRLGRFVTLLALALTTPSTWYLLLSLTLGAAAGYRPLYYSQAEVEAIRWLGEHSMPQDTVLSSYEVGGIIPAWTGHRVFWGHWAETIHLSQKRAEAEAFYSADEAFDRAGFLHRYGVAYVFYGPREREMGGFDPAVAPYLEAVFRVGDVTIYRVIQQEAP